MKEEKKLKKKAEDVAYRPGDGNLVGLIFFTPSPPVIFRSVVSLDQLGTPFSRRGFVEMELLGQLKPSIHPSNRPGPPVETGFTSPPSTVNNMVISAISEWAILDFALFLLVVTMGTCSTHSRKIAKKQNFEDFIVKPGTVLVDFKTQTLFRFCFLV